jgi:hypothetical protein
VSELVVLVEDVAPGDGGGGRAGEEGGQPHPQHEPHPVPSLANFAASSLARASAFRGCEGFVLVPAATDALLWWTGFSSN